MDVGGCCEPDDGSVDVCEPEVDASDVGEGGSLGDAGGG